MPEPEEIQFACIGCGTMNPAGSPICAGCGYEFAGPGLALPREPAWVPSLSMPADPPRFSAMTRSYNDRSYHRYQGSEPSFGRSLLKFLAWVVVVLLGTVVTVIAVALAGLIALFAMCNVGKDGAAYGIGFGLLLVGAIAIGFMNVIYRFLRDSPRTRREKFR